MLSICGAIKVNNTFLVSVGMFYIHMKNSEAKILFKTVYFETHDKDQDSFLPDSLTYFTRINCVFVEPSHIS